MAAYSLDFRKRLFNYSLTHSVRATAAVFHVSPNTVHLLQKRFYETGQLAPKPSRAGRPRAVSAEGELFLKTLILDECDLTLERLRERYAEAFGVSIGMGTMHDTLVRLGLTLKKSLPATLHGTPKPSAPKPSAITGKSIRSRSKTASTSTKPEPA